MAAITPHAGLPQDALGQVVMFEAADGQVSLDVRLEADSVWLSQAQMAELFGRECSVITRHVGNVFRKKELAEPSNVHFLHSAGADGSQLAHQPRQAKMTKTDNGHASFQWE